MQKLPVVSGDEVIKLLTRMGYEIVRQKGSHVRLRKETGAGVHKITVPLHSELAKGTLNDLLSKVALWNGTSKDELIRVL